MFLSIIIPCYNEKDRGLVDSSKQTLEFRLNKLCKYLRELNFDYELIFVNDGSTDGTLETIRRFIKEHKQRDWKILSYKRNRGKGFAIRCGIRKSLGDFILFMDADLSVPLENIQVAVDAINSSNCIIGDRYLCNNLHNRKPSRKFVSFFARALIKPLVKNTGVDTQCGFKMFPSRVVKDNLSLCYCDRWLLDVELFMILENSGIDFFVLPVKWNNMDKSTIGIKAVFYSIKELISIYLRRDELQK